MNTVRPVGTVELLRARVYPLDPETADHLLSTEVFVEPGVYPLYREMDAYYWMMTGRINRRGSTKVGDGIFMLSTKDEAAGPEVVFPSRRYGATEFDDLMAHPTATEGHPDQRLRVLVWSRDR